MLDELPWAPKPFALGSGIAQSGFHALLNQRPLELGPNEVHCGLADREAMDHPRTTFGLLLPTSWRSLASVAVEKALSESLYRKDIASGCSVKRFSRTGYTFLVTRSWQKMTLGFASNSSN